MDEKKASNKNAKTRTQLIVERKAGNENAKTRKQLMDERKFNTENAITRKQLMDERMSIMKTLKPGNNLWTRECQ